MDDAAARVGDRLGTTLASVGGLGQLPRISGFVTSAFGIAVALALVSLRGAPWFHYGAAMALAALLCLGAGHLCVPRFTVKPAYFVLDELCASFVVLIRFDRSVPSLRELIVALLVVRLFLAVRPPPCRSVVEWPGGRGLVMEGVIAGLYSSMLIYVLRDYFRWGGWAGFNL